MVLEIGQILLGKYRILSFIGQGGFGRVYLAEEERTRRRVVVKELRHDLSEAQQQEALERFEREIQVGSRLEHPHIVRMITYEEQGDDAYLVLEYMERGSLRQRLDREGALPVDEAGRIAVGICQALEYLHNHPLDLVHRDVTPDNILFTADGTAKLMDFGIVQSPGFTWTRWGGGNQEHPGHPFYRAPEAHSSDPLRTSADLFMLGCVLFEMLTGKRYKMAPPEAKASGLRPEVPVWLDGVLAHAVAEDPWDRYQEAAEMAVALGRGEESARREAEEQARRAEVLAQARRMSEAPPLRRIPSGLVVATPENLAWLLAQAQPPARVWWEEAEMELCLVPAGESLMGSGEGDQQADDDEKPQHRVMLDAYYIGRYPVTQAQYARFVGEEGLPAPFVEGYWAKPYNWDPKRERPPADKEDHPVVLVSCYDADAFSLFAGLRLPTEAEWEKAARGTDGRIYPWGNAWDKVRCNAGEGGQGGTTPVGAYSPAGDSPYGCTNMAGNVQEWCADWYGADSYRRSPSRNPKGPDSGPYRVLRSGSWLSGSSGARSAERDREQPHARDSTIGFRCCVSPTASP